MSQNWLITGAGRGFGRAFVSAAAESGAEVYAGVRHVPEGDPLFSSPRVHPLIFDVTKPGEVNAAVEKALGEAGHIDVLINNAGFGMSGAFEEMSDEELRGLMEADYYGVVNVTRAILPSMRGRRGGTILNVASQGGLMGFTGSSAYCSAKFAVVGLSAALRMELQEFGIRVSVLCPGSFRTDFRKKGSMRHPAKELDAYDGTAVRRASRFLAENPDSQKGRGHQETPAAEKQGMKQAAGTGNAPRSSEKGRGSGVQPPSGLNGPGSVFRRVRLSLPSGAETKRPPRGAYALPRRGTFQKEIFHPALEVRVIDVHPVKGGGDVRHFVRGEKKPGSAEIFLQAFRAGCPRDRQDEGPAGELPGENYLGRRGTAG